MATESASRVVPGSGSRHSTVASRTWLLEESVVADRNAPAVGYDVLRALLVGLVALFLAGSVDASTADARPRTSSVKKHPKAKHRAHKAKRTASKAKRSKSKRTAKRRDRHPPAERRPLPP